MVKRSRDEESALQAQQQAKHKKPTRPSPPKCCRGPSVGGGATEKPRGSVEKGAAEAGANRAAGDSPPTKGVAGDVMESHALCDAGPSATELPRWWQLWLRTGGGMVVDYEELLWGWFPFVDEDFSDAERMGWFSMWEDEVEWQPKDVFYDDIWQFKHINESPSHSS